MRKMIHDIFLTEEKSTSNEPKKLRSKDTQRSPNILWVCGSKHITLHEFSKLLEMERETEREEAKGD